MKKTLTAKTQPKKMLLLEFRFKFLIILILFFSGINNHLNAQASGDNDPTFNPTDIGFGFGDAANDAIETTSIQSDGKIIIGGNFTNYNGTNRNYITRLNSDGTLDPTFIVGTGANNYVTTIVIQSDGKIIIGGAFTSYNGTTINKIARLNTNGSLDATFTTGTGADTDINTTTLQPDGKIIIGGNFTTYNGVSRRCIARLNNNGTLDPSFMVGTGASNTITTTAIQTDGKIIIGGFFTSYNGITINRIARLNSDGTLDATFSVGTGAGGGVSQAKLRTDGKIIVAGSFTSYNGTTINRIARLNSDGTLDATFSVGTGADNSVAESLIQSDGKIIIGGYFNSYNGTLRNRIARLNIDGTLDTTFIVGTSADKFIRTCVIQNDGKIIIGGDFTSYNGSGKNHVARLNTDGSLDATFAVGTGANGAVLTSVIQSDGKIIIGGNFTTYNGTSVNRIARLNVNGTLDPTFTIGTGANGAVLTSAMQSDGKIIIGGAFTNYNGTGRNRIARLNTDGTLDVTFTPGTGAGGSVFKIAIQSDGKIIIGGAFSSYNGTFTDRIARLYANGSRDATFLSGSLADDDILAIAIQNDGKIIIGGLFTSYYGSPRNRIARLNTNGTLDATFSVGTGANDSVSTIALQSDGKVIIGGAFTSYNGTISNRIVRLNTNGSIDGTFIVGSGTNKIIQTSAIQNDGKIIFGGDFTSYNGIGRNRIARCQNYTSIGLPSIFSEKYLHVYPNPNSGAFVIKSSQEGSYQLINTLGQIVKQFHLNSNTNITISTEDLPQGVYNIIGESNGEIFSKTIIIE